MFEKTSSIIKDPSTFDYDYIPKNLVNRENQMRQFESLFRPLVEFNRSCNAFLQGSVGTGKTVTAKRFCSDMRDYCIGKGMKLDVIYINCRSNNSESAVLVNLIHHFDPGYPDRGFSTEEMARVLRNHLIKNKNPLVVILDEVNVLLKKNTVDIIYQITRMSDDVNKPAPVSLIMISQESIYDMMDEASASTFRRSIAIKFNKYSYDELKIIVSERAEEALFPGRIGEDAIEQIADCSEEYGDARMAVELLERAASLAEEKDLGEITVEDVRAAKALIYSTVSEKKLESLDLNRKIVLLAIARAMKQNVVIQISAAEKTYAVVCEEYEVPARKHTMFWKYVQDLEKIGLVKTRVMAEGKNGRTTKLSLPDIPSKVLSKKLEELIEEDIKEQGVFDEM